MISGSQLFWGFVCGTLLMPPSLFAQQLSEQAIVVHFRAGARARTLYLLGQLYVTGREQEKAVPYLQKALRYDANLLEAHATLGKAYLRSGKPQAAVIELEKALSLDFYGDLHYLLYQAYRDLGKAEPGRAALSRSEEMRKNSVARDREKPEGGRRRLARLPGRLRWHQRFTTNTQNRALHFRQNPRFAIFWTSSQRIGFGIADERFGGWVQCQLSTEPRRNISGVAQHGRRMADGFEVAIGFCTRFNAIDEILNVRRFVAISFSLSKHLAVFTVGCPACVADHDISLITEYRRSFRFTEIVVRRPYAHFVGQQFGFRAGAKLEVHLHRIGKFLRVIEIPFAAIGEYR